MSWRRRARRHGHGSRHEKDRLPAVFLCVFLPAGGRMGASPPRRRAGVAPAGAGWGVSCSGTSRCCACGRGIGSFAPPGASSFLSSLKESYQRKPLETTFQDFLGAGRASANLAVLISRNWCGGYRCRFGGLLVPPAPLPLTRCEGRIGCAGRVAIIKSRPLRREAPQWVGGG